MKVKTLVFRGSQLKGQFAEKLSFDLFSSILMVLGIFLPRFTQNCIYFLNPMRTFLDFRLLKRLLPVDEMYVKIYVKRSIFGELST